MRELTVNAKKAKRARDAIDKARVKLWFMIRTLYIEDEKNPAEAAFCSAIDLITRILSDPNADELVRKYASSPHARDRMLSALKQGRPPLRPKPGRRTNPLRDGWIAHIIEIIRREGFDPTRNDAAKSKGTCESACSIVATAFREIEEGIKEQETREEMRATLLHLGFTPKLADMRLSGLTTLSKALSEDSLERIWSKSAEAKRYRGSRPRTNVRH
jgi:hypothetical protein